MKLIILGASGMVRAGALRVALQDPDVEAIHSIGRRPSGVADPKLRELLLDDLCQFAPAERQLAGCDACLWAIGISSVGLDEAGTRR